MYRFSTQQVELTGTILPESFVKTNLRDLQASPSPITSLNICLFYVTSLLLSHIAKALPSLEELIIYDCMDQHSYFELDSPDDNPESSPFTFRLASEAEQPYMITHNVLADPVLARSRFLPLASLRNLRYFEYTTPPPLPIRGTSSTRVPPSSSRIDRGSIFDWKREEQVLEIVVEGETGLSLNV